MWISYPSVRIIHEIIPRYMEILKKDDLLKSLPGIESLYRKTAMQAAQYTDKLKKSILREPSKVQMILSPLKLKKDIRLPIE